MSISPEHVDLHRMADRFDPDRVRALRALQRAESEFDPVPFDGRDMHSSRIRRDVTRTSACLGPAAS
jgi:hypothetical protein